jgi:hypothetical protein
MDTVIGMGMGMEVGMEVESIIWKLKRDWVNP